MGPIQTLSELTEMLRRRALLIFCIVSLGAVLSVFYALRQPHVYVSSEVLQLERPKITGDLAPSTVNGSSARRFQLIEQQLMARDNVLEMIAKLGLFADLPALSDGAKVALFRESVHIEGVAAAREGAMDDGTISILRITAELGSPEKAQAVAHGLGSQTIEHSARARRAQTRATLDFFIGEERALVQAISDLEKEVAAFRNRNDIAITGRLEFRQSEMGSINIAIRDVDRNRIAVQKELEAIDAAAQRPATVRRVSELQRQLQSLNEQQSYLEQRAGELQQSLSGTPEIERELNLFERRMQQYQDQLEVISARRADAEIGHRLEENRQAERLEILEYASLPEDPAGPSRRKIALAGTVASLFAALALAYLLDVRHPALRSAAQMQRELGFLPAVSIPVLKPPRPKRPEQLRNGLRAVAGRIAGPLHMVLQRLVRSPKARKDPPAVS